MSLPPPSPRQSGIIWLALTGLAVAAIVALIVGAIWGLGEMLHLLAPVLWPLAVAGVLAYLLDPVVDFFERKGLSRTKAIVLVFAMAVAIFAVILGSVLPQVIRESRLLVKKVPDYAAKVQQRAEDWIENPPPWFEKLFKRDAGPAGTNAAPVLTNSIPAAMTAEVAGTNAPASASVASAPPQDSAIKLLVDFVSGRVSLSQVSSLAGPILQKTLNWLAGGVSRVASFFGLLAGLALIPVYAFYFLLEKKGIEKSWTNYLPLSNSAIKDELVFVLRSINDCLIAFFRSQVLVAICDGVLYTIGFLIIGLPYAVLLGVMATFLTMIPFLGAIATCATALVIAFAQFGDWQHPAGVLAVFAVVQTLEGFVIQPKIMGDRIGLHPLTVIIAIMVGTTLLGGLLGGILAIPLCAAGRALMFRYVWKRREKPAKE